MVDHAEQELTHALRAFRTDCFEDAIDAWRQHAARFADANDGVILAATSGAIGVRLGGASLKPAASAAIPGALGQPVLGAVDLAGDALPGDTPSSAHFSQVIGLVWRAVALWLFFSAAIMWVLRKTTNDAKLLAILEARYKENKANPKKMSGLAARLAAMQKEAEELRRQRESQMRK